MRPSSNTRNEVIAVLRYGGKIGHPNYQDLAHRVMTALAMTEAAFVEARRRSEQGSNR